MNDRNNEAGEEEEDDDSDFDCIMEEDAEAI